MIESQAISASALRGFDEFFARLAGSSRSKVEKHLAGCEKEDNAAHVRLWKRISGLLSRLTPDAAPLVVARAVQFFVPDGKYKLQVFALEDLRDGELLVYAKDARELALREGVLETGPDGQPNLYRVPGEEEGDGFLLVEPLTTLSTNAAPAYYKHMLGWNRTAIRITLNGNSSRLQIEAAESLCSLAAGLRGPVAAGMAPS
ncbi:MAG TPA: hypothetical protein VLJ39_17840 [Tepidisphaeraceae bacterium]|nr:hypothetical protein [Tepidisphaeraceae bacterium]